MIVDVGKIGDILISRPAGKEAFLMARSYIFNSLKKNDKILLDFASVHVLTPSWADEFISGIKNNYENEVEYINIENESVAASLRTIGK